MKMNNDAWCDANCTSLCIDIFIRDGYTYNSISLSSLFIGLKAVQSIVSFYPRFCTPSLASSCGTLGWVAVTPSISNFALSVPSSGEKYAGAVPWGPSLPCHGHPPLCDPPAGLSSVFLRRRIQNMNAAVAQIIAETATPTPMPALAPVLKPEEEGAGLSVCFAKAWEEVAAAEGIEKEEVDDCVAEVGTELLCAAWSLTDALAEEPGMVYPALL